MNIKRFAKARVRRLFEMGQSLGVDILPRHFYSEIPDIRRLQQSQAWRKPYTMHHIRGTALKVQLEFVEKCCAAAEGFEDRMSQVHAEACRQNGHDGYGMIESEFLFAFILSVKPKHIYQIGCGVSTAVILEAARLAGYSPRIQCVEPYPNAYLSSLARENKIELIAKGAEEILPSTIEGLPEGVFFFVDSSHTLGPAGEVSRIILEMLPRLKPGSWAHFHDIYFPYDYDREILTRSLFFSHETALLMALLTGNSRLGIAASLAMLHYGCPKELAWNLPGYLPAPNQDGLAAGEGHFPSSIYLMVT